MADRDTIDVTRGAMILFAAVAPDERQQEHLTNLIQSSHGSRYGMSSASVDSLMTQSQRGMRQHWKNVTPINTLAALNEDGHIDLTFLGKRVVQEMLV